MNRLNWTKFVAAIVSAVSLGVGSNVAFAQAHDHSHEGGAAHAQGAHAHSGESLAFRLKDWKSMHFDDQQKAAQHAETVKKFGCEVKQGSHAGHIDVTYRCMDWKTLQVANHKLAEQWEGWLTGSGFDVSHGHTDPAFAAGSEAIEFRMVEWKTFHSKGLPEEAKLVETLKKIGCEVRIATHDGHTDVSFRAPTWRDIHVADHAAAEQWMTWLKQNAFEAKHEH